MNLILAIMIQSVHLFISALMLLLTVRVLMSFFGADEESRFYLLCCAVTEPVVSPIRRLLSLVPFFAESPIDFSFMATCLILILVQNALPVSF
mgnify:CR=1 FL=1